MASRRLWFNDVPELDESVQLFLHSLEANIDIVPVPPHLREVTSLQEVGGTCGGADCFRLNKNIFILDFACEMLCLFGSTYVCGQFLFSRMTNTKSNIRVTILLNIQFRVLHMMTRLADPLRTSQCLLWRSANSGVNVDDQLDAESRRLVHHLQTDWSFLLGVVAEDVATEAAVRQDREVLELAHSRGDVHTLVHALRVIETNGGESRKLEIVSDAALTGLVNNRVSQLDMGAAPLLRRITGLS